MLTLKCVNLCKPSFKAIVIVYKINRYFYLNLIKMKTTSNQQPGYVKIDPALKDTRFPSFLQGFNRRWLAGNCMAVYLCFTPAGTAAALDDAINLYGKNVKIKSGGHCYENFVFSDETGAIIDVTPMGGYGYDVDRGYYLESGGTNWSAFQALFRARKISMPRVNIRRRHVILLL